MKRKMKVIAELVISPVGEGVSLSKYVKEAVKVIESFPNIRVEHHSMGTNIEADDIDIILEVTKKAHESLFKIGCQRVVTTLKIDDRRDKPRKMEDKVNALH